MMQSTAIQTAGRAVHLPCCQGSTQTARSSSGQAASCSSTWNFSRPDVACVLRRCRRYEVSIKTDVLRPQHDQIHFLSKDSTRTGRPRSLPPVLDDFGAEEEPTPSPPPSEGRLEIVIDDNIIKSLDLTPAHKVLRRYISRIGDYVSPGEKDALELLERSVGFTINYERQDPSDTRELSEYPDIRLWFVRLDAAYPWLPLVLDWRGGELARYTAMLVPHQMSRTMGLVFNPEAIELFTVNKMFVAYTWCKARGVEKPQAKLSAMMKMLGFSPDPVLFDIIERTGDIIEVESR